MSRAEQIRGHIAAHPGSTSKEIAQAIGWTTERVAAGLCGEMAKANPAVKRKLASTSITNSPIYAYYPIDWVEDVVEKPVPLVEKPASLVEKVVKRPYTRKVKVEASADVGQPVAPPAHDRSLDAIANLLAQAFAQQVARKVETHLATALQGMISSTHQPAPMISLEDLTSRVMEVAVPDVPRLPVVLIAGLLPVQAGSVVAEFGEVFDLRFFETNGNLQKLRAMAKGADHVFTFTSKVSHAVEEMMHSSRPDLKIHRCSGGMTMLKQQLLTLYADGNL